MVGFLLIGGHTTGENFHEILNSIALAPDNPFANSDRTTVPFQHILMHLTQHFGFIKWDNDHMVAILHLLVSQCSLDLTRGYAPFGDHHILPLLMMEDDVVEKSLELIGILIDAGMPTTDIDGRGSSLLHFLTALYTPSPPPPIALTGLIQLCHAAGYSFTEFALRNVDEQRQAELLFHWSNVLCGEEHFPIEWTEDELRALRQLGVKYSRTASTERETVITEVIR
jgi:hypothetical protein